MFKMTFGVMIVFLIIFALIGSWLWPYTVNSWLEYFGKEPVLKAWHGALLGFVPILGQVMIPAAAITFVAMLILK